MVKAVRKFRSLAEYRDESLGKSQAEVAREARVRQPVISQIEHGVLPKRKRFWRRFMLAYGLERLPFDEFERLALAGRKEGA